LFKTFLEWFQRVTKTALDLKPHERQAYKPDKIFKLRTVEEERKIIARRQTGWALARKAANLLKRAQLARAWVQEKIRNTHSIQAFNGFGLFFVL
jgi:hypothetical protein